MKSYDALAPTNDGVLRDALALSFPDWNGMLSYRTRKTFAEAVKWNDEMLSLFPPRKKAPIREAERSCYAEFVL